MAEGESTMASGIQAVAGIGPITFNNGIPQYRAGANQPMQTPVTSAMETPSAYPEKSSNSECQVLSNNNPRSLIMLSKTLAGLGKYGTGNQRNPAVITSQPPNNK